MKSALYIRSDYPDHQAAMKFIEYIECFLGMENNKI